MKKNIGYLILLTLIIAASSCKNMVDDLDNDPNFYTDAPLNLVFNHALLNVVAIAEADPARITGMFTDQFTGVDRQYGTYNTYGVLNSDFDPIWEDIYQRGITQTQIAKAKAVEAGNSAIEGQTIILEAYYFGEAALLFGDIPMDQVNKYSEFPDPVFEGQREVLNKVITMLDDGASKAGSTEAANNVFSTSSTWTQIASALKARYLLAMKDYPGANTAAKNAGFTSTDNNWSITHSTSNYAENMFWQFEVEQRNAYLQIDSSYMHQMLDASSPNYKGNAKTDEEARKNYYTADDGVTINVTDGVAAITASFPVISYSEMQLIIAETAILGSSDAPGAMNALNDVRAANAAIYGGGTYDAYEMADFEAGGMVNNGTTEESLHMEILKEKYCSVIGLPTFYDVNRTKNMVGVPVKNANFSAIPQRFFYPANEASSNSNFPGLVEIDVPTTINQ